MYGRVKNIPTTKNKTPALAKKLFQVSRNIMLNGFRFMISVLYLKAFKRGCLAKIKIGVTKDVKELRIQLKAIATMFKFKSSSKNEMHVKTIVIAKWATKT